jgi:DNA-directed RNA polymerases I and III subunit RPAC1
MQFINTGRQEDFFKEEQGTEVKSVHPDILIAKLRPGQIIDLTMHCHKGIGADHAKFSPVATASYRLLPQIDILKPILGADANKFQHCFPRGVISLKPVTKAESQEKDGMYAGKEGEDRPVVVDPMRDTVSREVLRHEEFKDKVRLGRVRDHFIFKIESVGQYESEELFVESVKLLKAKCARMKRSLGELSGFGRS